MQCSDVKEMISQLPTDELRTLSNAELLAHLESCPECRADFDAQRQLAHSFHAASSDEEEVVSMEVMRRRVEQSRTATRSTANTGSSVISINRFFGRPMKIAFGVAAAAMIIIAAVVPFQYDRTIGYELAMNGVSLGLVEDDEKVCDLLHALGLVEAAVDVGECDTTCSVTIFDLKTEQEARLVANSMAMLNENGLHYDVIPIRTSTTGSLFDQASEKLLKRST